jgi:serine/threonine protein kinase
MSDSGDGKSNQPIPGYELQSKLGEGGMAATYLARQTSMDRLVAIKIMRRKLARDQEFITRFQREAKLAGRLNHPNIVAVHDVGEGGGFQYLAMEYVEGSNARQLILDAGALESQQALDITLQVARALDTANNHGIIHRDIKPDNILVTTNNVVKVCDFGLARHASEETHMTQAGVMMGTPHYVSPEQARGDSDLDIRTDIYSLGATLYHMATGQTPFSGTSTAVVMTKHLNEQVPWPADVNSQVPENLCRLIQKMMARDRNQRYADPSELIADLDRVISGKAPLCQPVNQALSSVGSSGAVKIENAGKASTAHPRRRRRAGVRNTAGTAGKLLDPIKGNDSSTRLKLVIGGGLLLLLVVVGGIFMSLQGADPEATARSTWETKIAPLIKEQLTSAQALQLRDILSAYEARHGQTSFAGKKAEEIAKLKSLAKTALTTQKPSPPSENKNAKEMFEYAETWWKEHPGNYSEAIAKFKVVSDLPTQSAWSMRARDGIETIRSARNQAAQAAFKPLRDNADKLIAGGDYDQAIAGFGNPPEAFAKLLETKIKKAIEDIKDQASKLVVSTIASAEKLAGEGRPQEGLAELEKLKTIKYAVMNKKISELKASLEKQKLNAAANLLKQQQAQASKALVNILEGFDKLILAGKYQEAHQHLSTSKAKLDGSLIKAMPPGLKAAEIIVGKLLAFQVESRKALSDLRGKQISLRTRAGQPLKGLVKEITATGFKIRVRFRIGNSWGESLRKVAFSDLAPGVFEKLTPKFSPRDSDGYMAAALLAMTRGNQTAAGQALKAAGKHPLWARYSRHLDVLALGVKEANAKEDWEKQITKLISPRYSPAAGKRLLAALDVFGKTHGATDLAKEKKEQIAKMRSAAEAAIEASPEGLTTRVKKLFGGKVVSFDPKTLRIEVFYDFENPEQFRDWSTCNPSSLGDNKTMMPYRMALFNLPILADKLSFDLQHQNPGKISARWAIRANAKTLSIFCHPSHAAGTRGTFDNQGLQLHSQGSSGDKIPILVNQPYTVLMSITDQTVTCALKGRKTISVPFAPGGDLLLLGFSQKNIKGHYDNIRISGRLEKAWLHNALEIIGKPNPWIGSWQKTKSRIPTGNASCSAMDTKRGLYVVLQSNFLLQAYNPREDKWHLLSKGLGKSLANFPARIVAPGFVYDSINDTFVLVGQGYAKTIGGTFLFNPKTSKWRFANHDKASSPTLVMSQKHLYRLHASRGFQLQQFDMKNLRWNAIEVPGPYFRYAYGRTIAYNSKRKHLLFFGGHVAINDTWIFDPGSNKWTEIKPVFNPAPRNNHRMAYDIENDLVVLHAGYSPGHLQETWVFDPERNSWFEIKPKDGPPSSTSFIQYDPLTKQIIAWNSRDGTVWTLKISPGKR